MNLRRGNVSSKKGGEYYYCHETVVNKSIRFNAVEVNAGVFREAIKPYGQFVGKLMVQVTAGFCLPTDLLAAHRDSNP
jgi:hypothetical protein